MTGVEAAAIRDELAELDGAARARLRQRASAPPGQRCVALEDDGACGIYRARPLVCRSHGVPVRLRRPGTLPVVQSCELNFARGFDEVDDACVLDQATLSAMLGAVNALHAGETGADSETRFALDSLLMLDSR